MVAEEFSAAKFGDAVEIVLRPGCYLTYDIGIYKEAQAKILERNPVAREMQSGLFRLSEGVGLNGSVPEPGRAIVGLGKRDAAFDAGFRCQRGFGPGVRLRCCSDHLDVVATCYALRGHCAFALRRHFMWDDRWIRDFDRCLTLDPDGANGVLNAM